MHLPVSLADARLGADPANIFTKLQKPVNGNFCSIKTISMKKKIKIPKGVNPVAKARATGEHGAMRSIVLHTSKKYKKIKHKKSPRDLASLGDFFILKYHIAYE
jgi:hypothetical protein